MNDQPAPQATQPESTDRNKELVDAAISAAATPPAQPTTATNPPASENPAAGVTENVASTDTVNTTPTPPEAEENTTPVDSPIVSPEADTTNLVSEIPVNDSTVVTPDSTPTTDTSVQETTTGDALAPQVETPSTPTLEAQPAPTVEPQVSTQQTPAQPEGLVARFLHIFKK